MVYIIQYTVHPLILTDDEHSSKSILVDSGKSLSHIHVRQMQYELWLKKCTLSSLLYNTHVYCSDIRNLIMFVDINIII